MGKRWDELTTFERIRGFLAVLGFIGFLALCGYLANWSLMQRQWAAPLRILVGFVLVSIPVLLLAGVRRNVAALMYGLLANRIVVVFGSLLGLQGWARDVAALLMFAPFFWVYTLQWKKEKQRRRTI